mmetsp:Transcript_472/g.1754  ORF Transcript_472/g.1754 Transcript_472/m.1754 type:complete len:227 (+) Transcript_472:1012-1692(+)
MRPGAGLLQGLRVYPLQPRRHQEHVHPHRRRRRELLLQHDPPARDDGAHVLAGPLPHAHRMDGDGVQRVLRREHAQDAALQLPRHRPGPHRDPRHRRRRPLHPRHLRLPRGNAGPSAGQVLQRRAGADRRDRPAARIRLRGAREQQVRLHGHPAPQRVHPMERVAERQQPRPRGGVAVDRRRQGNRLRRRLRSRRRHGSMQLGWGAAQRGRRRPELPAQRQGLHLP